MAIRQFCPCRFDFMIAPKVSTARPLPSPPAKPRLLAAEDDPEMRQFLGDLLEPLYALELAADGEQAWSAVQRTPPALLLTDLQMPRLDGAGLIRRVRAQPGLAALPIVILTANHEKDLLLTALTAGADDFLLKPFSCAELLACLQVELAVPRFGRNFGATYQSRLSAWEREMRGRAPLFTHPKIED